MGIRVGLSFGFGPLRAYVPLNQRRRRRVARPAPVREYYLHDGCKLRHVTAQTRQRCTDRKARR